MTTPPAAVWVHPDWPRSLGLDDDVAAHVSDLSKRRGTSVSRAANDLIRAGLQASRQQAPAHPYVPPIFATGEPLVDVTDVATALEVLDASR